MLKKEGKALNMRLISGRFKIQKTAKTITRKQHINAALINSLSGQKREDIKLRMKLQKKQFRNMKSFWKDIRSLINRQRSTHFLHQSVLPQA